MTDTIDRPAADDDHVLDHLIIRFAGDSGDGMQLTGDRFTSVSASFGNDLSTLPDFCGSSETAGKDAPLGPAPSGLEAWLIWRLSCAIRS